jgi:DNA polymerase III delta prime subunit
MNSNEPSQPKHSLWVESYRPQTLDNYIGNDHLKAKLAQYIETGDIPHLLLFGKAGVGKTSLARLITNSIDCDYMLINASDENNVETVRTKIKGFASTMGFKPFKIIILDEFDYMTPAAQSILRNLMEVFSSHCRFILTCNYVEKIIDPIQSRCQTFQIIPPSKKEVAIHIAGILKSEGISFTPNDLVPIIDSTYPDIRRVINTCQLNSNKGVLTLDTQNLLESDYKFKILSVLTTPDNKRNRYTNIRQIIADSKVTDFTDLFHFLYEKVDEYCPDDTANVILTLSEGQYKSSMVIDKEINMMATLINILNILG